MSLKCQLCNSEKPLIKAHLFGRNYFFEIRSNSQKKHLLEIEVGKGFKETKRQSGAFDPEILCATCDNEVLGVSERYAYSLFPPEFDPAKISSCGGHELYSLGQVDGARLTEFLIAQLWKLHVSQHTLAHHVNLGDHYSELFKDFLLEKSIEAPKYVSCVVILSLHPKYGDMMLPPFRNRFDDVNCYHLYFPPWKLIVRVDRRPFSTGFSELQLKDGLEQFALVFRHWSESEVKLMKYFQDRARINLGLKPFT